MKKMLPEGAVRQKMSLEGFSEAEIDSFIANGPPMIAGAGGGSSNPTVAALPPVPERRHSVNSGGATKCPVPVAPAVAMTVAPAEAMTAAVMKAPEVSATSDSYVSPSSAFFPYDALRGGFPSSVDPTKKEEYLDDSTFQQLFGEHIDYST